MLRILISTSSFDLKNNPFIMDLERRGFTLSLNHFGRRLTESEVLELMDTDVVGIIAGVESLTRRVIESAKNLKIISRCGVGTDNIDVKAAEDHQISIYNTPEAPVPAVAEFTIGIILAVLRRILEADRNIRNGTWKVLRGNLLSKQTVGIIGYGRIGKRVGELLRAFGAKLLVCDLKQDQAPEGGTQVSLPEILARADIITLHLPYESSTHHILDKEKIGLMKKGSILINASRGGLVCEESVVEALRSGHLRGAAFDTFEEEPYTGPMSSVEQAVLTSHMGSSAKESREQMELKATENLVTGLIDKKIINN